MDKNTYSENTLLRELFSSDIVIELSEDYIVPDSIFDSEQVLKTTGEMKINELLISEGVLEINGNVCYEVLLLCEDGSVGGVTYNESFSTKKYIDGLNSSCEALLGQCCILPQSKLINPRKVNIASRIVLNATVYCPVCADAEIIGSESLDDEMSTQRKQISIKSSVVTKYEEKDIPVSHDINLDGNNPPISKILFRSLRVTPYEIKARENTVEVKTYACLSVIYLSEEGNRFSFDKSFIIEKIIDFNDADKYEWSANISQHDLSAQAASNSYGEMKIIELDFDYDLFMYGLKNVDITCYDDMYSTEYACECEMLDTDVTSLGRVYGSSLSVNASISREELNANDITSVLSSNVTLKDCSVQYSDERRKLLFEGNAIITLVCENVSLSDEDKKYSAYAFEYPFKCDLDGTDCDESTVLKCRTNITDIRYRADSSKLYCDFEASIKVMSSKILPVSIVTKANLNKNAKLEPLTAPITLCYPSGNEKLWDIAKYYKTTKESIIFANSLSGDDISDKKVLLIPSKRHKKASYTNVI